MQHRAADPNHTRQARRPTLQRALCGPAQHTRHLPASPKVAGQVALMEASSCCRASVLGSAGTSCAATSSPSGPAGARRRGPWHTHAARQQASSSGECRQLGSGEDQPVVAASQTKSPPTGDPSANDPSPLCPRWARTCDGPGAGGGGADGHPQRHLSAPAQRVVRRHQDALAGSRHAHCGGHKLLGRVAHEEAQAPAILQ